MKLLPSPLVCSRRRRTGERLSRRHPVTSPAPTSRKAPGPVRRVQRLPRSDARDHRASGTVGPEDLPSEVVEGLVNLFRQYRADEWKGPHGFV